MVIGYKSLRGKCAAIPCHIQLAALVVMGVEWAEGWGARPVAAQVFKWALIRLVNSDANLVVRGLRHNITDSCYSMKAALEHFKCLSFKTVPYTSDTCGCSHSGFSNEVFIH